MKIKSLNTAISLAISILLLAGVTGLVWYVSSTIYSITLDIESRNMNQSSRSLKVQTDEYLDSCLAVVRALNMQKSVISFLEGDQDSQAAVFDQLDAVLKARPELNSVFLFDRKGKAVAGTTAQNGSMVGSDLSGRAYFSEAMQGKESIGKEVTKAVSSGALVFLVVVPVRGKDGAVVGGAGLAVNWSKFIDKFIIPIKIGTSGYAYILDSKGVVIGHPDKELILKDVTSNAFVRESLARKNGSVHYTFGGIDKIQYFTEVERTGWIICANDTEADLAAEAIAQRNVLIGCGAAVYLVLLGLILFMVRSFVLKPIGLVKSYSAKVAQGDLSTRLEGEFKYELADLAHNVSTMTAELKQKLSFAQGVLKGLAAPVIIADLENRVAYTNQAMMDLLDKTGSMESHIGQSVGEFFYGDKGRDTITGKTLREQKVYANMTADLIIHNGKKLNVTIDCSPMYDLEGKLSGSMATVLDISAIIAQQCKIETQGQRITEAARTTQGIVSTMTQATAQLSAQVEQCSHGASTQSQRVSETATAMEEMNSTVIEVAKNAAQAADTADRAKRKAQQGADVVSQVVAGIGQAQTQALSLREDMTVLGNQAQSIGQIMNVISDIADQTNLLALNAAIEAARAGEAGRGFAVVADEVRKLAEKTMSATKEVGQAIQSIQDGTQKNIRNVELAVTKIDESTTLAHTSGQALSEIVSLVDLTTDQVRSIATAAEEQSASTDEISRSIEDVNRISLETSEAMQSAAESVHDLADQARVLGEMIAAMETGDSAPETTHSPRAIGR